jgi:hypothetical protein
MKIIKKFWGVALVVILLASMFLGTTPVSAGNYRFSADLTLPSAANGLLDTIPGTSFLDVAKANDGVIYAVTSIGWLYKSPAPGVWYPANTTLGVGTLVAVAPDNSNIVAVVDTVPAPNAVWISLNGGTTFRALAALPAASVVNCIDISTLAGSRFLAVGGHMTVPLAEGSAAPLIRSWEIEIATAWVTPDSAPAADYAALIAASAPDDVVAVKYSSGFSTDQSLLSVFQRVAATPVATVAGSLIEHVYSYMYQNWDANFGVGTTFPRTLKTSVVPAPMLCNRATIALDANFVLGDSELGFIGADITTPAATEGGGVWRMNTGTPALTKIYDPTGLTAAGFTGINSVAWDGTNLMAANYDIVAGGALTVYRCANVLASSGWVFLPSAALKTPGTGINPLVLFNGGVAYAFSSGNNAAVCTSTDLGKSFDGVALVNSASFNNMTDIWVSNDGARMYALTDDGANDIDIWSKANGVWKRSGILAGMFGRAWIVRAAQSSPDVVYLGEKATKNMYKSIDGGNFVWTQRTCTQLIADFAVQNALTVYVAVSGLTTVVKTTTGASGWLTPVATNLGFVAGGNCYSINLVANDQVVVGGLLGGVSYSNNGATSFTYIPSKVAQNGPGGRTLATATTTAGVISTGDTIFVASTNGVASDIAKWVIGTNTGVTGWSYDTVDAALLVAADITGLVYANGVLYAWDNGPYVAPPAASGKSLFRFILPTFYVTFADDIIQIPGGNAAVISQVNMINALQYSIGSTTLWARDAVAGVFPLGMDTLLTYTEYLVGPAAIGPVPTYPINGDVVGINSISGFVNDWVFRWNTPPAVSTSQFYTFDLNVFLDEAGTVNVGGDVGIGFAMGGLSSSISNAAMVGPVVPVPGTTYYWQIRTATPVTGYWSAMQMFNIHQLTSIVPTLGSPVNGADVESTNPAFSWNPISGATTYDFMLDTGTSFAAPLYHVTAYGAGMDLPVSIQLERGRTYFWRVRALTPTAGEWSTIGNFTVALEQETTTAITPTVTTITIPAVTNTTITIPQATSTIITMPQTTQTVEEVNPTYIWAIIIIGAVLVLAVIVLIVRTRRSV